jgi:hypothetical protein
MEYLNSIKSFFDFFGIGYQSAARYIVFGFIFYFVMKSAIANSIGEKITMLGDKISSFGNSLGEITSRTSSIEEYLAKFTASFTTGGDPKQIGTFSSIGVSKSPMRPSPDGEKILEVTGAKKLIDNQQFRDEVFRLVDLHAPKNGYDVENTVMRVLMFDMSQSLFFTEVKQYLYEHPVYEGRNLNLPLVTTVMSWPLRDIYMITRSIS